MKRQLSASSDTTCDLRQGSLTAHLKRRSRLSAFQAFAVAGLSVLAASAHGQFIFQPLTEAESLDAKVYKFLQMSFQSDLSVVGQTAGDHQFASLLQFNLEALPISGEQVTGATLELFSPSITTAGEVGLFLVTSPWAESSVTWDTFPTYTTLIDSVLIDGGGQTFTFDVTSAVEGWASGDIPNYGFAIRMISDDGNVVLADVDRSGAEHAPKLTVVPEPSSALATLCGCAVLGAMRRRSLPRRVNS